MANGNGAKTNKRIIKGGAAVLEAERERVEKALAETEQSRTTPILNSLSEHVVFQDLEQRVLWANKAAGDSVGLSSEELVGRYCYDVWGRGGEPCPGCPVTKARKTRKPQAGEMTTPDGKVWLVRGYPVRDASGDITGLVEMTLEITERKKSEEQLQAERNKLQSVIGAMEDGLNIMDKDYNIIYQSRLPRKLYGDRLGEKCYRVYAGEEEVCVGCPVKKAFNDGKSHSSEKKLLTPSGKVSYWETIANPVRDASGHIVSCLEIARNITERKQAEDELKAERNKLKSVVNAMADGLTIHDKEFNIIYQNEQVRNDYGDRVGEKCYRVYENIDTVCDGCPVKKAFKDGKSHTADRQVVLPSGKVAFSEVKASPIRDAEGRIVSCLEIIRDTNERKQAEEALRESEEKFRLLAENSLMGIFIIQDSKIVYLNPSFAKAFGYKPEEIVNSMHPSEFIHPDDKNFMMQRLADRYAAKVTDRDISFKAVRRDGSTFFVEATAVLTEYRGKPAVMGTFIDITERKQAEDELKAEKNKLQSVVDAIEYGITIQDRDYNVIYQNEQAKKPFGERIGEKCYRAYSGKEQVCDGCPVEKAFKDGKSHTVVRPNISPSGKVTYWENTANPVRDAQGNIVSCLEVTRDITKRKQAEEALANEATQRRILIEQSLDGIVILDEDARVVEANKKFAEMLGYTLEEVRKLHTWDWDKNFPPEQLLEMGRNVDEKGLHLETKHHRKDGTTIDVEISINGAVCAGKKLIFCVCHDITERKKADEQLQAEKNKLQSVIGAMEDALTIQDRDFNVIYQNEQLKKLFGDRLGEKCYRAYEGREELCVNCPVKKSFKDGKSHSSERKVIMPSGEVAYWENTASPIRDGQGNIVSCLEIARNITERKQAEQELMNEATRRRILIDQSSDGIVILDEKGKVYEANQKFAEMLGYTYEEAQKLHVWDWEFQYPREQVAEMIRTVDETGDHFETRHRRKDGTTYDVEISTNGAIVSGQKLIFCVCRDITERKQADRALAEAEKKYKNLVEAASDLVWEADGQGRYTFVSSNIKDLLGYEVDEVVGKKRTLDFAPKKEVKKWLKRFKEVNAKRESFSGFEVNHLHKDGTPVVFEVSGIPLFDSAGEFKGYVGTNKDITERKQMTEALKESQKFSNSLMENSPNPKFVLNPDTSVRYVNPTFEKLTGYKLAEIAGKKAPYPWWLEEEKERMTASLKDAMASGGRRSEKVFHKKNGERFWVALNSAPIMRRKKLRYFVISWLDITDRKRAEEEKVELEQKAHLASRLASVGEMASGIAHEINNPLTAVIGFSQLLMDNDLPEEIKEDLVIINKEAQRAAGVARNLLTFARKHAPSKQPTSVNGIIEGVLTLRAYEQNVSNIQINTKLASGLPEVMADYSQLQQVFINIILNAESAMLESNNGGTLTITTQKFNNSVRASFADDGPGIDKENLDRIFDPFFTTKEVGKGTGLGLSVCHGIIAEHGGKVYAKSKLGGGATFVVELPISSHEQSEELNEPEQKNLSS